MILRPSTLARGRIVLSRASRSYATKPIPATQLKKDAIPKRLPANKPLERPYVYSVENKNPSNLFYPERLLIYDSGASATSFVAFTKVALVFAFGISCVYVAPTFYADPDTSNWHALLAVGVTGVCLVFYSSLTAPYVAQINVKLPKQARVNVDALKKWLEYTTPTKMEIDLTTVRLNGLQKTTSTTLGELRPLQKKLGRIANIGRDTEMMVAKRSWYAGLTHWLREPRTQFYVGDHGIRRSRAPGAWNILMKRIGRNPPLR